MKIALFMTRGVIVTVFEEIKPSVIHKASRSDMSGDVTGKAAGLFYRVYGKVSIVQRYKIKNY